MEEIKSKKVIRTYRDLNVYQESYRIAMDIFRITKCFPKEEIYSLASQIRRSSRSIPTNIAEGWAKRKYKNVFLRHLVDANGSCEETKVWLTFAKDCNYISEFEHNSMFEKYNHFGAMLNSLINNWQTFSD